MLRVENLGILPRFSPIVTQSKAGEGTTFIVRLKRYKGEETSGVSVQADKDRVHIKSVIKDIGDNKDEVLEKHTLLVIEDNLDMLAYLKEMLQDAYNVFCATNGLEALQAGVVDFINKPFNIEELKAKIVSIIKMGELLFEKSKKELIKQVITSQSRTDKPVQNLIENPR